MELQRLKKSLTLARRGWKLLKDKQDELMRLFLEKKDLFFARYGELSEEMRKVFSLAIMGNSFLGKSQTRELSGLSKRRVNLEKKPKQLFNLKVSEFEVRKDGEIFNWKKTESVVYWDKAASRLDELMEKIVEVGTLFFEIEILCREISATRRRVNSLEYIMIPNLVDTIKYINFKLEEMERASTVRLMKVKEIVRSH